MSVPESTWISLAEVAGELGISTRTVRRMVARGDLAAYRLPGSRLLRVRRADLDQLLRPVPTLGSGMEAI